MPGHGADLSVTPRRSPLSRYARWLHTGWPAGRVEPLPAVGADGATNVPGLFIVGDLTGIPLLKFAADTGARAAARIAAEPGFRPGASGCDFDVVIVGAGVSGMAAALQARAAGLTFAVLEASRPLATIVNFPRGKPIFTYPKEMVPAGKLSIGAQVKEALVEELERQTVDAGIPVRPGRVRRIVRRGGALEVDVEGERPLRAQRVIVAVGRSGDHRRLGVPGEALPKVSNRLHDPKDFAGRRVLVVGGGDAAAETAIALAAAGAAVTLSYRGDVLARPKPDLVSDLRALEEAGAVRVRLATTVSEIREADAVLSSASGPETIPADAVFVMIGREPPLGFLRRSGVKIRGAWSAASAVGFAVFLALCVFVYNWKANGSVAAWFREHGWFPFGVTAALASSGGAWSRPSHVLGTAALSLGSAGFYYSLAYCACVVIFGLKRMRRQPSPYVRRQTWTLIAVQVVPLFLLPYLVLPWLGHNGVFDAGAFRWIADQLFPATTWDPQGREYWRSFGLVLAWPLFIWNVFSSKPLALWLSISVVQTFVIIPLIVYRWGKGAYCGWICSCGALSETLGDAHRAKMPHGPLWNRLNLVGQVVLGIALVLAGLRIAGWIAPGGAAQRAFDALQPGYYWIVDVGLAGIVGVGTYFHFSGRVWCRFACPLAALMHVYARFSTFRILADKKKCISCNVCTSVCHQGIDVMSFANKGLPMEDPQCVRCSACVASCPTDVLSFGRVGRTGALISVDALSSRTAGSPS
jgi:thioredoxin reductase/ferredoxin